MAEDTAGKADTFGIIDVVTVVLSAVGWNVFGLPAVRPRQATCLESRFRVTVIRFAIAIVGSLFSGSWP
ncbi:hypothetical protein [Salinactinospora qingdaonensis]|uniref:hypothetical protein n=1 Tax=Salinactinospora qingdaonensis TaxID=702744 RepID=UPI0031E64751